MVVYVLHLYIQVLDLIEKGKYSSLVQRYNRTVYSSPSEAYNILKEYFPNLKAYEEPNYDISFEYDGIKFGFLMPRLH
jgi:hypothetical protein